MNLSVGASRLLDLLKWYRSKFPKVFVSLERLASHVNRCTRTVKRWLAELRAEKLLSMEHHGPRGSVFSVPDVPACVPDYVPDSKPQLYRSYSSTRSYRAGSRTLERKPPEISVKSLSPAQLSLAQEFLKVPQSEKNQWMKNNSERLLSARSA